MTKLRVQREDGMKMNNKRSQMNLQIISQRYHEYTLYWLLLELY